MRSVGPDSVSDAWPAHLRPSLIVSWPELGIGRDRCPHGQREGIASSPKNGVKIGQFGLLLPEIWPSLMAETAQAFRSELSVSSYSP